MTSGKKKKAISSGTMPTEDGAGQGVMKLRLKKGEFRLCPTSLVLSRIIALDILKSLAALVPLASSYQVFI
jgi:hypothetical protein